MQVDVLGFQVLLIQYNIFIYRFVLVFSFWWRHRLFCIFHHVKIIPKENQIVVHPLILRSPNCWPPGAGGGLSMRDLSEIKALKKPPPPVRMLMEVCCLLFQIEPVKTFDERARKRIDYWEPARRYLLSDPFLLSKLRSKQDLEPAQRAKIQKYFKDPNFTSERVLKCSKAAYELYACVSSLAKGPRESEL